VTARVSPARSAAFDILYRVLTRDAYTSELLHSDRALRLSAADHGLATELVMGVLRWQKKLDSVLQDAAKKSILKFDVEVKLALRLGAYQLLFLDRIPARAAVNESVELVKMHGKRSAGALVNAVLRNIAPHLKQPTPETSSVSDIADTHSHPQWLTERWAKTYGIELARKICSYNQQRPPTTIRSTYSDLFKENPANNSVLESIQGVELEPAAIVQNAWQVLRGDISATRAYREHKIAVQDEGSQLVGLLAQGTSILDCCAAPGGKSAIATEHNPSAFIVSMDLHVHRVGLMRQLNPSLTALAADARQLPFNRQFDCVIADLPCTGTGTLARNPEIKWRLTPVDLLRMADLQLEILDSAAHVARSIVYSTCSLEPEEGEEVIAKFLSRSPDFRIVPIRIRLETLAQQLKIRTGAVDSLVRGDFLRTIPGIHPCDGFFAAFLQRR
jgi:16S rRNA (cytosine967-C5)-methyltransferase